jgi:polar amino acid transport system permease protein
MKPHPTTNPANRVAWRSKPLWVDIGLFLLMVAAIVWMIYNGTRSLGYNWQWYRIASYLVAENEGALAAGPLLTGLGVTLKITAVSFVLAFTFGLVTALLRLSNSLVGKITARVYLETIRNTPLLVQLFFIYFVLSPVLGINAFFSAVLALSLFEGAYASEILRAGIVSIHRGQWEAAFSLGLNSYQTYRTIILPQAIRRILPPLSSQAISLIKDSALVSTIAIYDLTMQGQAIIAKTFLVFEVWFTVAAIYLAMTLMLSQLVKAMEGRMKIEHY